MSLLLEKTNSNGRRGLHIEELTFDAPGQDPEPVSVKHHTLHLARPQIEALRKLSYELKLEMGPSAYSQSEIARAAIQWMLDLDPVTRELIMAKNREREEAGEWGAGYPRPGA